MVEELDEYKLSSPKNLKYNTVVLTQYNFIDILAKLKIFRT